MHQDRDETVSRKPLVKGTAGTIGLMAAGAAWIVREDDEDAIRMVRSANFVGFVTQAVFRPLLIDPAELDRKVGEPIGSWRNEERIRGHWRFRNGHGGAL